MKIYNDKKGFSVIEGLIVLVVVVALGFTGYFVFSSKNTNSGTAHAGSWTNLIYEAPNNKSVAENVYACVDKLSSSKWLVKGLATLTPATSNSSHYSMSIIDWASQTGGSTLNDKSSHTWWDNDVTEVQFYVNPNVNNWIGGWVSWYFNGGGAGSGGQRYHARDLASC